MPDLTPGPQFSNQISLARFDDVIVLSFYYGLIDEGGTSTPKLVTSVAMTPAGVRKIAKQLSIFLPLSSSASQDNQRF